MWPSTDSLRADGIADSRYTSAFTDLYVGDVVLPGNSEYTSKTPLI